MEPKLCFTIPSVHDDITIDCRIYYSIDHSKTSPRSCVVRGAIIAHPYAPLGGSYDDPVVGLVISEMLERKFGFLCTFNFRGVYGGSGHTSWTGKAERSDYESVIGFMVEFLRGCDALADLQEGIFDDRDSTLPIQLVLGGYSYGSWICTHLPDISDIMKQFRQPTEGSAAAEINARAQHLATQTNIEIRAAFAECRSKHSHTLSVGGEEISPEKRRRSGESSPSRFTSEIRKSLDFARKIGSVRKKHYEDATSEAAEHEQNLEAPATPEVVSEQRISVAYLLISPLLPPISAFTTLPFGSNPLRGHGEETLHRLASSPTLAVFANNDSFTSVKKLRSWAQDLSNRALSKFQFVEIDGAGHFWRTHQVQKSLKVAVGHWVQCLLSDEESVK